MTVNDLRLKHTPQDNPPPVKGEGEDFVINAYFGLSSLP